MTGAGGHKKMGKSIDGDEIVKEGDDGLNIGLIAIQKKGQTYIR